MNPVYRQITEWSKTPFLWGQTDCWLSACDWILKVTGKDPAETIRGSYDSPISCQKVTKYFSDPLGVTKNYLKDFDLKDSPDLGDIGLIEIVVSGKNTPVAALWLGTCWGIKSEYATTTVNPKVVRVLAVWDIGYA